ncbi:MAG: hypothetical protein V1816_18375, partial [Pseudomonadota bacterium]
MQRIRLTLAEEPAISRRALARRICEWSSFVAASGRLKETACRKALAALNHYGLIGLAPSVPGNRRQIKTKAPPTPPFELPEVDCDIGELGQVEIELVADRFSQAAKIWK